MIELTFVITAFIAIFCALLAVSSRHVVHALLFMVVMMLAIALLFFLLGAPFAAALQVIVYAGAIMVLFIFVTMMLHQGHRSIRAEQLLFGINQAWLPLILSTVLLAQTLMLLNQGFTSALPTDIDTTKAIGKQLFGPYYQLVILAALMLLSSLISAIHIAAAPVTSESS